MVCTSSPETMLTLFELRMIFYFSISKWELKIMKLSKITTTKEVAIYNWVKLIVLKLTA
jgi:hypothetical protein